MLLPLSNSTLNKPPAPVLRIDWATHGAAHYACRNWHYSRSIPAGKIVKIGVYEDQQFIGVVLFSRGANSGLGNPYGCAQDACCELTRIALTAHVTPVSRIMTLALKFLKKNSPTLKMIVSYADPEQGHHGGVYQATNWVYTGKTPVAEEYVVNGKRMHGRTMRSQYGTHLGKDFIQVVKGSSKHRYIMVLDDTIRPAVEANRLPYPKRDLPAVE